MSLRFAIKNTAEKAVKEGDSFVRYSGSGEPFNRVSERPAQTIEMDTKGNPTKWKFLTGLDPEKVDFYTWFSDKEKEVVRETIQHLTPLIERKYGKTVIGEENHAFWKKREEIGTLKITHENTDVFFDTEKAEHALLYLSIVAGAFIDLVAPNKDYAEANQVDHYLALEIEGSDYDDEDITRSDAHFELASLRKEFGKEAIYILAWCLQYDTRAFGAYSYRTPEKDLLNYHIKYIDGKLSMKKKKNTPKTFIEYAKLWRGAQTRQLLYTEAYVKAGDYFNFVTQREKKYVTSDGTVLGNTVAEAVKSLMNPKFNVDYEKLREQVEAKWKE